MHIFLLFQWADTKFSHAFFEFKSISIKTKKYIAILDEEIVCHTSKKKKKKTNYTQNKKKMKGKQKFLNSELKYFYNIFSLNIYEKRCNYYSHKNII